ncbi:MAG: DMT family transporter [Candidatus Nitrotoga sp.]
MASKQKILSVIGLLSGALVWGLMWYPYRALNNMGVGGELSTLLSYVTAMVLGLLFLGPIWRELRVAGWLSLALMASAGWTNVGYVLAMLDGEVMRVLLLFYLAPLWTIFFSYWLLGEKLNYYGYAIIALSLGGAFVMLWDTQHGLPLPQSQAEWIGLSAGVSFALMNVIVRRAQHLSVNFKAASIWLGTILFTTVLLLYQGNFMAQLHSIPLDAWWLLLLIGLVLCAISFVLQYGLTYLPANQAIVLFLSELVFAAVSAYFLADEEMGLREVIGAVLIVSASLLSGKCTPLHEK